MKEFFKSFSPKTKAGYLLWTLVNFILLMLGWSNRGYIFNQNFFPFESHQIATYDLSEFFVYTITPFVLYYAYTIFVGKGKIYNYFRGLKISEKNPKPKVDESEYSTSAYRVKLKKSIGLKITIGGALFIITATLVYLLVKNIAVDNHKQIISSEASNEYLSEIHTYINSQTKQLISFNDFRYEMLNSLQKREQIYNYLKTTAENPSAVRSFKAFEAKVFGNVGKESQIYLIENELLAYFPEWPEKVGGSFHHYSARDNNGYTYEALIYPLPPTFVTEKFHEYYDSFLEGQKQQVNGTILEKDEVEQGDNKVYIYAVQYREPDNTLVIRYTILSVSAGKIYKWSIYGFDKLKVEDKFREEKMYFSLVN